MTPNFIRNSLAIVGATLAMATAPAVSAAPFTVTINDNNSCKGEWQTTGTAHNTTVTCVTTTTPPPEGAPTCTITNPLTIAPNTSASLVLGNCSVTGGGTITYAWNQGSPTGTLVATTAAFATAPLTSSTTFFATATANGLSTTYQTTVTVSTPTPPPTAGSCSGYSVVNLGELQFNGVQLDSSGMTGSKVAVGRITVPNPLPAGWLGKTASVAVLANGNATAWRKVYLSKSQCDFTGGAPKMSQGITVTLNMSFGVASSNAVMMLPGETWYLNIKDELPFGGNSCGSGYVCDFGLRMYPPSN